MLAQDSRVAWWGSVGAVLVALTGLGVAVARLEWIAEPNGVVAGEMEIGLRPRWRIPAEAGPPLDMAATDDGRLLIATRNGRIYAIDSSGQLAENPLIDMPAAGIKLFRADEGGLCGIAIGPPHGPATGKVYTFTTEQFSAAGRVDFSHPEILPSGKGIPADQIVIREWSLNPPDPDRPLASSRVLMRVNHPGTIHHGGGLAFGPDGYLYISMGDGGGGNDREAGRPADVDGHTNSVGNAQDLTNVFGKILRINPTGSNSANGQYGVPRQNPFARRHGDVREIYAYGLRNPYRIRFDPPTGRLYAADVGQSEREEVDVIRPGGNYGWPLWEGTRYNGTASGRSVSVGPTPIEPIAEYSHWDGMAVIGGFLYRGTAIHALTGKYLFGDYFHAAQRAGRLFYTDAGGGTIMAFRYSHGDGLLPAPPEALVGIGRDAAGEPYALFDDGQIVQLVPPLPHAH